MRREARPIVETMGSGFPRQRPRRLRRTPALRRLVRETRLSCDDLLCPLFVVAGRGIRREIASLPGVYHLSADEVAREAARLHELGVLGVLLFGIPQHKDPLGSEAYSPEGVVQQAVRAIKAAAPQMLVFCDLCLCEYTDHGHCGVVRQGEVDNDATLELLGRTALTYAQAGADFVAPSDMMDGRVGAVRSVLDEAGYASVGIMAYSVKYASAFYGPFRDAAGSAPQFGDRRGYQMDPANAREALREFALDVAEGADIVMVKPALAYLDVLARVRAACNLPLAAYNVSGEYAMIKAAAQQGWLEERSAVLELLTAIKRAGADIVITYHAPDVARWLREEEG